MKERLKRPCRVEKEAEKFIEKHQLAKKGEFFLRSLADHIDDILDEMDAGRSKDPFPPKHGW